MEGTEDHQQGKKKMRQVASCSPSFLHIGCNGNTQFPGEKLSACMKK